MIRKGGNMIFGMGLLAAFCLFAPYAEAADSGPGVWDFLLFGNLTMGSNFNAGSLGTNTLGTTVYKGTSPVSGQGYGLGFGTEVWFTDNVAARLLLQGNVFANGWSANIKNGPFFGFGAATIGPVFKLFGTKLFCLRSGRPGVCDHGIERRESGDGRCAFLFDGRHGRILLWGRRDRAQHPLSDDRGQGGVSAHAGILRGKFLLLSDLRRLRSVNTCDKIPVV